MDSWLAILTITAVTAGLGSAAALLFLSRSQWSTVEGLFASVSLGTVLGGWLALVLAELGIFSIGRIAVVWLLAFLILIGLVVWLRRRQRIDPASPLQEEQFIPAGRSLPGVVTILLLTAWLVAAGWLFFRPHEYILGGADAGVYVSLGAEIAQHGGFKLQDETLADLDPALKEIVLRPLPSNPIASSYLFPGFYVVDEAAGDIVPQFFPLHPVWQAVAFGLSRGPVEGVTSELLVTGLWMTLASLAVILTAREVGGWLAALLVMLALAIGALQVWFARYPTTEALTQFLVWAGLWAMVRWQGGKQPGSFWALVAGTALGAIFLVRIDILILLPVFGVLLLLLWLSGWRAENWWFAIPLVVLVTHAFLHGVLFSAPYFYEHVGFGLRLLWVNWWIPLLGFAAGILMLWVLYAYRERYKSLGRFWRPLTIGLIGSFLAFAIYGWFVRPYVGEASLRPDSYSETLLLITNHENWRRLAWYLSTLGIWLGVAGICLLLWNMDRKTAVLVVVGILFSVVYLWNVRANPHHIYVMRRYVPVVAPFFILAAAYFLSQLAGYVKRQDVVKNRGHYVGFGLTGILAIMWLAGLGWSARGFIRQVDFRGVLQQLALIESDLPPDSILLFNDQAPVGRGDFWGTPLTYVFGHNAFTIRDLASLAGAPLAETVTAWQSEGRTVVWVGDPQYLLEQGYALHTLEHSIESERLEGSYEHKPSEVIPARWQLPMSFIEQVPTAD